MAHSATGRFYAARRRVYAGLAVFAGASFLAMILIPAWRVRLSDRLAELRSALRGDTPALELGVGENQEPFPAELERPSRAAAPAAQGPAPDIVFNVAPQPRRPSYPAPSRPRSQSPAEKSAAPSPAPVLIDETAGKAPTADSAPGEGEPRYSTGALEREAYELVLKSHPAAAELVGGSDPELRFLSWDAAPRGNDIYWVRLRFKSEEDREMEYIWQVTLGEKKAAPLNYNARSLP